MARRTERRTTLRKATPVGELDSRLIPEEEARLHGQIRDIAGMMSRLGGKLIDDYHEGRRCLEIDREALWQKARRPVGSKVLDYISEHSKIPRSTLEPRLILARSFSIEQIEEAASRGACLSTLAEVGRGKPALRGELMDMALKPGSKGATFSVLRRARMAGNKVLRAYDKKTKKKEGAESPEAVIALARASILQAEVDACKRIAESKRRELARATRTCPQCAEGGGEEARADGGAVLGSPGAGSGEPGGADAKDFLERDGQKLFKEALEAQVRAEHANKEALASAEQARLQEEAAAARVKEAEQAAAQAREQAAAAGRETAVLAAREAALAERQALLESGAGLAAEAAAAGQPVGAFLLDTLARLRAERDALSKERAATETAQAETEKARAETDARLRATAEAEARAAALERAAADKAQAVTDELAAVQAARQAAEEKLAEAGKLLQGMEQEKAQFAERNKQAQEREAELARKELDLGERRGSLDVRDQALRTLEAEAEAKEVDLARREKELAEHSLRVHQAALGKLTVDWMTHPGTLDEVLLFIKRLSLEVSYLCPLGRRYLEQYKGLSYSELDDVREANLATKSARADVDSLMDEIIACYEEHHGEELAEFNERIRLMKEEEARRARYRQPEDDEDDDDDDDDDEDDDDGDDDGGGGGQGGGGGGYYGGAGGGAGNGAGGADRGARNAAGAAPHAAAGKPAAETRPPAQPKPPAPTHVDDTTTGKGVTLEGAGPANGPKVPVEVLIGSGKGNKKQWGLLGLTKKGGGVFVDINHPQVFSIYGLQKYGKTSTILSLVEMMMSSKRRISHVPRPFGGVWAHFGLGGSYPPGICQARYPNNERHSIKFLTQTLGTLPEEIKADMTVFVPPMLPEQLAERQAQFPGLPVEQLAMTVEDFGLPGVRIFMAAAENSAMYMSVLDQTLRSLSPRATLAEVEAALEAAPFTSQGRGLVNARWASLRPYLTGTVSIRHRLKPGVLIVLDIRGEWITEREAMALFAVLMNTFSLALDDNGQKFCKFMVFDEAQKYMAKGRVSSEIIAMIREMRHRQMTVMIASQDPEALEFDVHRLSTVCIVHKTRSKDSLKVLLRGNAAWEPVTIGELAAQEPGDCYIAASDASVEEWKLKAQPCHVRPTCAKPGGTTQTAVPEDN